MITLPQLKALAKQNKIPFTCVKKDKLIEQLTNNNIITPFDLINPKIVVEPVKHNTVKNEYERLKGIRTNPKTVEVFFIKKQVKLVFSLLHIRLDLRLELIPCI